MAVGYVRITSSSKFQPLRCFAVPEWRRHRLDFHPRVIDLLGDSVGFGGGVLNLTVKLVGMDVPMIALCFSPKDSWLGLGVEG